MIFVALAYEQTQAHTAGFLGLQVALLMVAVQNVMYVIMTGQHYDAFARGWSAKDVAIIAKWYLFLNICISSVKVYATVYIVMNTVGPDFYKYPIEMLNGMVLGKLVDFIWMLFNAVIPFFIAVIRMKTEDPLEIDIDVVKPLYKDNNLNTVVDPESEPLNTAETRSYTN